MFLPSISDSLAKPYDIALTLVVQAEQYAQHNREPATFSWRQQIYNVFTTPSGQLRYQVGILGKPSRNRTPLVDAISDAEREAQEIEARGERVPMKAEVSYCPGHAPTVLLNGSRLLAIETTRGYRLYFHVGAMPRGQSGRKDYGGELVEGPWAFANGRAVCLTASEAIRERDAREEAAAILVKDGSLLMIDEAQYRVEVVRGEHLNLHLLRDFAQKG